MPAWLQILLGLCAAGTPFILWMLRMADAGRDEMKADIKEIRVQVTAMNGKIARQGAWIDGHEEWSRQREVRIDGDIKGLEERERKARPSRRRK